MAELDRIRARLAEGLVIPAHPLALTPERRLDERRQRALTRYYLAAGAGGLAVAVHTTQFAIRDPAIGLFEPVLRLAQQAVRDWSPPSLKLRGTSANRTRVPRSFSDGGRAVRPQRNEFRAPRIAPARGEHAENNCPSQGRGWRVLVFENRVCIKNRFFVSTGKFRNVLFQLAFNYPSRTRSR